MDNFEKLVSYVKDESATKALLILGRALYKIAEGDIKLSSIQSYAASAFDEAEEALSENED